jgi:two-component system sensor histidine kinase UhpB
MEQAKMSLRLRLIALVCCVLLASLALGGVIAYGTASRSVRTEMGAALSVGRQTLESAVYRLQNATDPERELDGLIASFEGNRHLRVSLVGKANAVASPAVEASPFGAVPGWFVGFVGVTSAMEQIPVSVGGRDFGTITIETDPQNEMLEVWNEFGDSLAALLLFCGLTILLIHVFIGRALRPLDNLAAAMEELGDGRYRARISGRLTPELSRLRDSFNRMTARLAKADAENRRLNEQLLTLQEQERSDLARDLHDEVSPFLFAVNVDASTASRLLQEGRPGEARNQIDLIADAVHHMQRQVRRMLSRLRPVGLAEFGLGEAVENIVAFWRRRRPEIRYEIAISPDCENLGELLDTTICRIVQEAVSNAVRHAAPTSIAITIDRPTADGRDDIRVKVADNGGGTPQPHRMGYGLVGLAERVKAIGGQLNLSSRAEEGFILQVILPCSAAADAGAIPHSVQAVG